MKKIILFFLTLLCVICFNEYGVNAYDISLNEPYCYIPSSEEVIHTDKGDMIIEKDKNYAMFFSFAPDIDNWEKEETGVILNGIKYPSLTKNNEFGVMLSGNLIPQMIYKAKTYAVYKNKDTKEIKTLISSKESSLLIPHKSSGSKRFFFEAEEGIKDYNYCEIKGGLDSSENKYIHFVKTGYDYGIDNENKITKPALSFNFNVDTKGDYYVYIRCLAENASSDSVYCGFDNSYEVKGPFTVLKDNFIWYKVAVSNLDKGKHTFDLFPREKLKIDCIVITDSKLYVPTLKAQELNEIPYGETYYEMPDIKPLPGHPRVYFKKEDIENIIANSLTEENKSNLERHISNLSYKTDGILKNDKFDSRVSEVIESLAFEYALRGNKNYGYKAIAITKNFIDTLSVDPKDYIGTTGMYNYCSQMINILGEVYDWCYDLLSDKDKLDFYKMFLHLASNTEVGWPPLSEIAYTGHGAEGQLQRDMMCVAIAMYDEFPSIYQNVGGRFFKEYVDFKKFMYKGHVHQEGDHYFQIRYQWEILATFIMDNLGVPEIFGKDQQFVPYWYIYARRPDGSVLRNGDSMQDCYPLGYYYDFYYRPMLLASSYFKDPYLKFEAERESEGFKAEVADYNRTMNCVEFLIFNDPNLKSKDFKELPLTKYFPKPYGGMIARTSWEDGINSPAVVAEMKIKEYAMPASHAHLDSGAFQIYYKGALANDTGFYATSKGNGSSSSNNGNTYFGSDHYFNYYKRTIAHNTMLIYDPLEKGAHKPDGGQRYLTDVNPPTFDLFMKNYDEYKTGEVMAQDFGPSKISPSYTYLKGDLSFGYREKVDAYERSFMFLNLFEEDYPGALIVFDRVVSKDPAFKKSWILHGLFEPEITENKTVFKDLREGYNGKIVVNTMLPEKENANITKIGGPGFDFFSKGTNYMGIPSVRGANENANGWRIEVSPKEQNKIDLFLNVIEIGNINPNKEPYAVEKIETPTHIGVSVKDRLVFFGREKDRINNPQINFEVKDNKEIMIADLAEGKYKIKNNNEDFATVSVTKESGILYCNLNSGSYTICKI